MLQFFYIKSIAFLYEVRWKYNIVYLINNSNKTIKFLAINTKRIEPIKREKLFLLNHFLIVKNYSCKLYYSCPNFPTLSFSAYPTPCSHGPSPHCCSCPWVIHTCSLSSAFPFFLPISPSLLPSGHFHSVPCFHACGSTLLVSLFCSLDSSYRWDHMGFVFQGLAYFT